MLNLKKGGIETIITVIILVGLIVALIISAVLPAVTESNQLAHDATGRLSSLDGQIKPTVKPQGVKVVDWYNEIRWEL